MLPQPPQFSYASRAFLLSLLLALLTAAASSQTFEERTLTEALLVKLPKTEYEVVGSIDPVLQMLVSDRWRMPEPGDELVSARDTVVRWERVAADSAGWFRHAALSGGYALFWVRMPKDTVLLLRGMGNSMAWVNGAPRAGKPYADRDEYASWEPDWRYALLPVALHKGENHILFYCSRDACKAVLAVLPKPVLFNRRDVTVPDLVAGEKIDTRAAIVVVNGSKTPLRDYSIRVTQPGGAQPEQSDLPLIQSLTVRKVGFALHAMSACCPGSHSLHLELLDAQKRVLDTATLLLRVLDVGAPRRETFISTLDGSTQYFAVNPQIPEAAERMRHTGERPALLFSLHGASVEAIGQASAYSAKRWAVLVAPTNRRPYGYNWEDWGRLDALEVLDRARKEFHIDESRIYLTGHSMGGHGTWHLGVLYPDLWAAVGPSAGWVSFWSYRVRGPIRMGSAAAAMTFRGTNPSDTKALAANLAPLGVYILHGSIDDNVLATESRGMAARLAEFHHDFIYHEQQGENHWWDISDEPGADCVDWAPMQDFFNHHRRPRTEEVRAVDFTTPHPGISATCYWVTVLAQVKPAMPSTVSLRFDPGKNRFSGSTANVARLALDLASLQLKDSVVIAIDERESTTISIRDTTSATAALRESNAALCLEKTAGHWSVIPEAKPSEKNPRRCGPFKDVFRNNVVLVFGTRGSAEENRWAFEQARYDAERFWYQGNGSMHVVSDMDFEKGPLAEEEHLGRGNVVLYGNANSNTAWKMLLGDSPVQVRSGAITIGKRTIKQKGLFCLFIRPRAGSDKASVAAVSGTDIEGMRATLPLGYLSPGIPFPDLLISNADVYTRGEDALVASGYFGIDWSVDRGDIAWNIPQEQ